MRSAASFALIILLALASMLQQPKDVGNQFLSTRARPAEDDRALPRHLARGYIEALGTGRASN
jgi:hypothetical protein